MQYKAKLSFILLIILSSCVKTLKYAPPKIEIPEQFKEAGIDWHIFNPTYDKEIGNWWHTFNDPYLNELVERANENNNDIKVAESNYKQALFLVDKARISFLPSLTASTSIVKGKQETAKSKSIARTLSLEASWEVDLWGNIRKTVEAAQATSDAAKANHDAVMLSTQASLAQYYYELKMLDKDQELLDKILEVHQQTLQYTKNRYKAGVVGDQDVALAEQQYEIANNDATNNKINRAQYQHAIAVLSGEIASNFSLKATGANYYPYVAIPITVPSTILQRRSDIIVAERQVAAASANIGIIQSSFFPTLSLTGAVNYQGTGGRKLASFPDLLWSVGPELALNLTNLVGYKSALSSVKEAYNASVANYKQTVLNAFQDVEDNMSSLRILTEEVAMLQRAADHAKRNLKIISNQFRSGIIDKSQVYAAKITYYNSEKSLNDIQALRTSSAIGLIKALGGVWSSQQKKIDEPPAFMFKNLTVKAG